MRIAHLADVHLGYRAYNRVTRQGMNLREADVFNVFRQAMRKVVEIQPDLIVIAGDLFHVVRPSNLCIENTFKEFKNIRNKMKAPIILIGGNHDSPRSIDTGCILDLLTNIPGVYVAHSDYRGIAIPEIDTTVFCLCHRALAGLSGLKIEPDPASRYNVLAVHGTLEGISRNFYDVTQPITRAQIMHDGWDYIALGHYHLHEKLADNSYYSGSLEYTSFNIWEESNKPKGFIEFDLDERKLVKFHKTNPREVIDLRAVDAEELTAAEISQLIQMRVEGISGGHKEKVVRLVVDNVPKSVIPDLDYQSIRRIRSEAVHFDVQLRPRKKESIVTTNGESRTSLPLEEEWRQFAKGYELPGGIDRESLVSEGLEYIGGVE
ncbi:MAG: exonuclease SbcCD subunit D [Armatimonadota bacterium]